MKDSEVFTKEELQLAVLAVYKEQESEADGFLSTDGVECDLNTASKDLADVYMSFIHRLRNSSKTIN